MKTLLNILVFSLIAFITTGCATTGSSSNYSDITYKLHAEYMVNSYKCVKQGYITKKETKQGNKQYIEQREAMTDTYGYDAMKYQKYYHEADFNGFVNENYCKNVLPSVLANVDLTTAEVEEEGTTVGDVVGGVLVGVGVVAVAAVALPVMALAAAGQADVDDSGSYQYQQPTSGYINVPAPQIVEPVHSDNNNRHYMVNTPSGLKNCYITGNLVNCN